MDGQIVRDRGQEEMRKLKTEELDGWTECKRQRTRGDEETEELDGWTECKRQRSRGDEETKELDGWTECKRRARWMDRV